MPERRTLLICLFSLAANPLPAEDFTYTTNNGAITITGYAGPGGDVTIPSEIYGLPVTIIGYEAFWGCTSLANLTIPDSVTTIAEAAFTACTSLRAITVDPSNSFYCSADGVLFNKSQTTLIQCPAGKAGSYTAPNSVLSIGDYAFWGCTSLTNVALGTNTTTIGDRAFYYCTSLDPITIPRGVTNLGNFAFSGCHSLASTTIPDTVTTIRRGAFHNCTSLTSVTIPDGVITIETSAFEDCTALASITLPGNLTSVEAATFAFCSGLANVTIGNSVTNIGNVAFTQCYSLTNITIPKSVTSIGSDAFSFCTNLKGVFFQGNPPALGQHAFDQDYKSTIYYLPGGTGWGSTFGGRPTSPWHLPYPVILSLGPSFGVQTNAFGFRISWATNASVVVDASTSLGASAWSPVGTNTINTGIEPLTDGWSYFSDPDWTNYPARFYRIRSP